MLLDYFLLLVWRLNIGAIIAGTGRGQLEGLDDKGEVFVIGVIDQEPVVDALLETLGLIAGRHERASLPSGGALLNPGCLGEGLVVGLHSIHHHPPLAVSVDCPQRHDVGCDRGAEVGLLHNLLQSVHAVLSVGQHVLVHGLDSFIVVLEGMFYLIGGVLSVLKAPGLGVVNRTCWGLIVGLRLVVGGWLMVGWGRGIGRSRGIGGGRGIGRGRSIGRGMTICWGWGIGRGWMDNSMGNLCVSYSMSNWGMGHSMSHRVNYSLVVDRAGVVHKGSHRVVVHRGIGGSRGGSVAVHLAVGFSFSLDQARQGKGGKYK